MGPLNAHSSSHSKRRAARALPHSRRCEASRRRFCRPPGTARSGKGELGHIAAGASGDQAERTLVDIDVGWVMASSTLWRRLVVKRLPREEGRGETKRSAHAGALGAENRDSEVQDAEIISQ